MVFMLCDAPTWRIEWDATHLRKDWLLSRTFKGVCHSTPSSEGSFLQLLRRYNQEMVSLRIQFLTRPERSAESRTILVRDIPGVYYGSLADRVERTALRFLPAVIKRSIVVRACLGTAPEIFIERLTASCMLVNKHSPSKHLSCLTWNVAWKCLFCLPTAAQSKLSIISFCTMPRRSSLCHYTIKVSNRLMLCHATCLGNLSLFFRTGDSSTLIVAI